MPFHTPIVASKERLAELKAKMELYQLLEQRERCQDSLRDFVEAAWPIIDASPFQNFWGIDALCDHLEAVSLGHIPRLLINIPPRAGKTTVVSIMYPAWVWARTNDIAPLSGPQVKFLCASYSDKLTLISSNLFRRLVLSDWYQKLFPSIKFTKDQNTKGHMDNQSGGSRQATSVGGSLLGLGGDILICLPYQERVLTSEGWLSIGQIVSEKLEVQIAGLSSYDEIVWQDIEKFETNPGGEIVEIKWDGGSLRCTGDHPIFVESRGYIRADSIQKGEIVYKTKMGGCEDRSQQTQLHDLQQSYLSIPVRGKKAKVWSVFLQPDLSRVIFQGREKSSICSDICKTLHTLWQGYTINKAFFLQKAKILLSFMSPKMALAQYSNYQKWYDSTSSQTYSLSCMSKNIFETVSENVSLFQSLCSYFSIGEDHWFWKRSFCPWQFQFSLPSGIQQQAKEDYQGSRWAPMRDVRKALHNGEDFCSPSYRLQQTKFGSYESDDCMQQLSCQDKREGFGTAKISREIVQSVTRVGWEETTYNVRVAPCHNYFAEGILVHNCDDLNNTEKEKKIETGAERESSANFFTELRSTRRNNPKDGLSAVINVQQRVNEDDTSGVWLSSGEDVCHLMIPMRHDPLRHCVTIKLPQYDDDEPWEDPRSRDGYDLMWPERFGELEVRGLEKALGPFMASGRLQQTPSPKGGGILRREWWRPWDELEAVKFGLEWQHSKVVDGKLVMLNRGCRDLPHMELIVGSLDTAYKEKEQNDYNAFTIWGIFLDQARNRRAMLMYAWHKRLPLNGTEVTIEPGEHPSSFKLRQEESWGLVDWIAAGCKKFKVRRLLIEDKSRGSDVANELQRIYNRDNWGVQLVNPVGDKVSRAHSVVPLFADGAIYAPYNSDTGTYIRWADEVIEECRKFDKGPHDDFVDSTCQFLKWARDNDILVMASEMEAAQEELATFKHNTDSVADLYGV